ncbi:MAG: hypothetical protein ABRQ33_11165, partial [Smithellaceae bacterium]
MFVKSDIRKITIALEKEFSAEVYLALGRAGIIHLARFEEKDFATDAGIQAEESLAREIVSFTDYAFNALLIEPEEAEQAAVQALNPGSDAALALKLKKTVERAVKLRKKISEEAEVVTRRMEYTEALNMIGVDPVMIGRSHFVKTVFGTVNDDVGDIPATRQFMIAKTGKYVFGVSSPADFPAMTRFLQEYGFNDQSADIPAVSPGHLQKRSRTLQRRGKIIDDYILHWKEENRPTLQQLRSAYTSYGEMLKAMQTSLFSARTMFITGWMDMRDKQRLVGILQGICANRFILAERKDPRAPVRLLNVRWLQPFELLVKTMGMPSNSEIDPTPFAAVTFVL